MSALCQSRLNVPRQMTGLPGFQEKGKIVAAINSPAFRIGDVNILRACAYHCHRFLNCFHCRIAAEHYMAL
jgi:hypothetical protein